LPPGRGFSLNEKGMIASGGLYRKVTRIGGEESKVGASQRDCTIKKKQDGGFEGRKAEREGLYHVRGKGENSVQPSDGGLFGGQTTLGGMGIDFASVKTESQRKDRSSFGRRKRS